MHVTSLVRVAEFHRTFNHPIAPSLTVGTAKLRRLRVALIAEELKELADALGVPFNYLLGEEHECKPDVDVDIVEAADALGDLDYVVNGAFLVFGIPGDAINEEVHRSNMSKAGADGKPIVREDGKILKGPNYTPPNIFGVLERFAGVNLAANYALVTKCACGRDTAAWSGEQANDGLPAESNWREAYLNMRSWAEQNGLDTTAYCGPRPPSPDDASESPEGEAIWTCKVGGVVFGELPKGADTPMRDAIERAFLHVTGAHPQFNFSGWGGSLTNYERLVVNGGAGTPQDDRQQPLPIGPSDC